MVENSRQQNETTKHRTPNRILADSKLNITGLSIRYGRYHWSEIISVQCLSESMTQGDLYIPLKWSCAFGHEFEATPNLVLRGGHWCPECERSKWNYAEVAKSSPFFAQVWTPIPGDDDAVSIVKEYNDMSL